MSRRGLGLLVFLLLTFGLTWLLEIGLLRRLSYGNAPYQIWIISVMFVPALCAFLVRRFVEREGFADAGLRWGRGRYYLWAWLAPIGLGLVAGVISVALRQAEYDPYLTELLVKITAQAPAMKIPPLPTLRFYLIAAGLTQAVVMNLLPCFGEEFGWRGYLLMRLRPLGTWRALTLSGLIWGLWHAPIILQGHNYPDHPQLGVLLMIGFCVLLSIIFGWLRLASGSVFTAAVAHASVNGPALLPFLFMRGRDDLTSGLTGLLGQGVMALFVLALWRFGAFRGLGASGRQDDGGGDVV